MIVGAAIFLVLIVGLYVLASVYVADRAEAWARRIRNEEQARINMARALQGQPPAGKRIGRWS